MIRGIERGLPSSGPLPDREGALLLLGGDDLPDRCGRRRLPSDLADIRLWPEPVEDASNVYILKMLGGCEVEYSRSFNGWKL